jgi:anti-sigma regulatory factor (Ser/Thr protein kinase)
LTLRLAGGPKAPARARSALRSLDRTLTHLLDDVDLLVSELVSNSVLHARANQIELHAYSAPELVRVEVRDQGPGFDAEQVGSEPSTDGEGGFGLLIVDKVADRWGVTRDRRPSVWFEIDRTA